MKFCVYCKLEKEPDQFFKNKAAKDGLTNRCKACFVEYNATPARKATVAKYGRSAKGKAADAKYQASGNGKQNLQRHHATAKGKATKRRYAISDKGKANIAKQCEKWRKKYPEKAAAKTVRYYASKISATPKWVDRNNFLPFYELAQHMTKSTGIPHEVDHIIPLKNNLVCGLNVPWNLRVIPASQNRSKRNLLLATDPVPAHQP